MVTSSTIENKKHFFHKSEFSRKWNIFSNDRGQHSAEEGPHLNGLVFLIVVLVFELLVSRAAAPQSDAARAGGGGGGCGGGGLAASHAALRVAALLRLLRHLDLWRCLGARAVFPGK